MGSPVPPSRGSVDLPAQHVDDAMMPLRRQHGDFVTVENVWSLHGIDLRKCFKSVLESTDSNVGRQCRSATGIWLSINSGNTAGGLTADIFSGYVTPLTTPPADMFTPLTVCKIPR